MTYLKVEHVAQTTFRFSPVCCRTLHANAREKEKGERGKGDGENFSLFRKLKFLLVLFVCTECLSPPAVAASTNALHAFDRARERGRESERK
jgi:hypothetical protein